MASERVERSHGGDGPPDVENALTAGSRRLSRRSVLRGVAAGAGAATVGAAGLRETTQPAEAIPPLVIAPALVAGGVTAAWAVRKFDPLGSDSPPSGMTRDALLQKNYEIAKTRKSTNASTIVDNKNLISGVGNNAYVEGKLAAFEALNAGKTKSEVTTAATDAANVHFTTIEKNIIKSWNENISEVDNMLTGIENHPNVDTSEKHIKVNFVGGTSGAYRRKSPRTVTLADGSTMESKTAGSPATRRFTLTTSNNSEVQMKGPDGSTFRYLNSANWNGVWSKLQTEIDDVNNGLTLWVDSVYGSVQSGSVAVSDLISPKERAAMMTDNGDYPQAVADLIALNIPVDYEREATISIDYRDVTVTGKIGMTSPPSKLESGVQYNPSNDNLGDVYVTYDVSKGTGTWNSYGSSLNGGVVTFSKEPYKNVRYVVATNKGEKATAVYSDFTEGTDENGNPEWTADLSEQLDSPIADVSEVTFNSETDKTQYETTEIQGNFTIKKFVNEKTGEEEAQASFTDTTPQNDSNYITQSEWDELESKNKKLIEEFEQSQQSGGGGGGGRTGGGGFDLGGDIYGVPVVGWVAGGLAGLGLLSRSGGD